MLKLLRNLGIVAKLVEDNDIILNGENDTIDPSDLSFSGNRLSKTVLSDKGNHKEVISSEVFDGEDHQGKFDRFLAKIDSTSGFVVEDK